MGRSRKMPRDAATPYAGTANARAPAAPLTGATRRTVGRGRSSLASEKGTRSKVTLNVEHILWWSKQRRGSGISDTPRPAVFPFGIARSTHFGPDLPPTHADLATHAGAAARI